LKFKVVAEDPLLLECAYETAEYFCDDIKWALQYNREAVKFLNNLQYLWKNAANGIKRINQADKLLQDLLTKTNQKELIDPLKRALKAELGALTQSKVGCFTDKELDEPTKEQYCGRAYGYIGQAILKLIDAIVEVYPDERKRSKIEELFGNFHIQFPNAAINVPNEAYKLAENVLAAM
uniref:CHAD domain-containing protein n=1 Tax=Nippostrongylus brasiliensis TaxID=27835 RepID=A0A0N4XMP7_NIPBR